jgi:hypothetical protein
MIQKSYILFAILLTNLLGQSFSGVIKDISGEPISHVIIEEINANLENTNWTMSDENGGFIINVNNESDVLFKRIGFENLIIKPNERLTKYVTMFFDNISLETVDVYGRNKNEYLRNKTSYNNLGTYSRGGSLNQIPSLEMRTYGGYAGVTSASFDGGFARHTKVLYNGVDLTDAMNGQTDLSTLPSFALKIYKLQT